MTAVDMWIIMVPFVRQKKHVHYAVQDAMNSLWLCSFQPAICQNQTKRAYMLNERRCVLNEYRKMLGDFLYLRRVFGHVVMHEGPCRPIITTALDWTMPGASSPDFFGMS